MPKVYDTVIKICTSEGEIAVEQHHDGVISRKTVKPETLMKSILGSRFDNSVHTTGFLPEHCFSAALISGIIVYYMRYPNLYADISYFGTEYPDFPLPRLVFAIKYLSESGKIGDVRLAVVNDERLSPDTVTYAYPFSNVYSDCRICLGNNALPVYKDPTRIHTLPQYILGFPNNNDMFRDTDNRLGLGYRDLLEHLKDKDPNYYYSDVLVPNGKTLKDFMNRGIN